MRRPGKLQRLTSHAAIDPKDDRAAAARKHERQRADQTVAHKVGAETGAGAFGGEHECEDCNGRRNTNERRRRCRNNDAVRPRPAECVRCGRRFYRQPTSSKMRAASAW